ncbi:MAG: hypothetical protein FJX75_23450 [Armatimonadetes bacterium]|nr:hypothetical protein [Armatimonadota bacterium]
MSEELPPAEPVAPTPDEDDDLLFAERPPRAWRRWVIVGLIVAGVLAVGATGLLIYFGVMAWQRQIQQQFNYGLAPATPRGQGPFDEALRFKPGAYVQAIGGGDVDGDGQAEAIVWAGKTITIRDSAGQQEAAFPSRLDELTRVPSVGSWMPATPGGGIRRPHVGTLHGKPVIAVTDGVSESVYAYRASGGLALENRVANTRVRCLAVADLNGDGEDELLVGRSSAVGLVCVGSGGPTKWKHGSATDPSWVCVGDGNGDHKPEVFVGYDTSVTQVLDANGRHIGDWPQWLLVEGAQCADLDGDGKVEFLLSRSLLPSAPTSGGGASGSGGSGSAPASFSFGLELQGLSADGTTKWNWPLPTGQPWATTSHLGQGDFNADGKGEWIASAPDGSVRVYDVAGSELGNYALGKEIQTLGVVGSGKPGEKPQVWVSLGEEIVVLTWR